MSRARFFEALESWLAHRERGAVSLSDENGYLDRLAAARAGLTEAENAAIDAELETMFDARTRPRPARLPDREGRALYAVAIELLGPDGQPLPGSGEMYHTHAHSSAEAVAHFRNAFPNRRTHRIVDAALPIGYYVEDREGMVLSLT